MKKCANLLEFTGEYFLHKRLVNEGQAVKTRYSMKLMPCKMLQNFQENTVYQNQFECSLNSIAIVFIKIVANSVRAAIFHNAFDQQPINF